jgi:hypothetical protein
LQESGLDLRVLGFTFGISVLTGIIFGLAPALQASKVNLNETLKEGGRSASNTSGGKRLRGFLVVAETALALVLLVCAGLMIKSFVRLQEVNPGFNPEGLLSMRMNLPPTKYAEPHQQTAFYNDLLERVRNTPGVQSAAVVTTLPLSGANNITTSFVIEGAADEPTGNLDSNNGESVMGLLRGLHAGGATICVVTHDPRYADRAIHLFDGRIVAPDASVVPERAAAVSA